MKTIILAVLLMGASVGAIADELTQTQSDLNAEKNHICSLYGSMFESAAAFRDQGARPEETLERLSYLKMIPLQKRKNAINLVYFDPAFKDARGHPLAFGVIKNCLYGPEKPIEPLK